MELTIVVPKDTKYVCLREDEEGSYFWAEKSRELTGDGYFHIILPQKGNWIIKNVMGRNVTVVTTEPKHYLLTVHDITLPIHSEITISFLNTLNIEPTDIIDIDVVVRSNIKYLRVKRPMVETQEEFNTRLLNNHEYIF